MTRQQKVRQQKAMEKADANLDKLAMKVKESKARGRKVQARAVGWEELNGEVKGEEGGGEEEVEGEGQGGEEEAELDVGMEEAEQGQVEGEKRERDELAAEAVALPEPEEDEEL